MLKSESKCLNNIPVPLLRTGKTEWAHALAGGLSVWSGRLFCGLDRKCA